MDRQFGGNQSRFARETGLERQKLRKAVVGTTALVDLDVVSAVAQSSGVSFDWIRSGAGVGPASNRSVLPAQIESNAELVELGAETLWVPLYPARLAAGPDGGEPFDIGPEGAVPLPGGFARAQGLGASPNFSAYVRGDSMRDDFDDGDLVFGLLQEEWDREGVYALYIRGELLVKRVRKTGRHYDLVSTNPKYSPIPIDTDDVRLIGRVVGAISRV